MNAISKAFSMRNKSPNSLMGLKFQADGTCKCWTAKNKKIQKMSNSKGLRMSWTQSWMEIDSSGIKRKTILENEFEKKRFKASPMSKIPPKRIKSMAEFSNRYEFCKVSIP
jgi:hypothetical protein